MPDLSNNAVREWLVGQGPDLVSYVGEIESVETWTLDDQAEVVRAAMDLGWALDGALMRDPALLAERLREPAIRDLMRTVLAYMRAGRRFRTLQWLTEAEVPQAEEVWHAILAPSDSQDARAEASARTLRSCLRNVGRREMLDRIFSSDRIELLLAACQPKSRKPSASSIQENT